MLVKPVFRVSTERLQPEVGRRGFMVMPFSEPLDRIYRGVVEPTVEALGCHITRADDFFNVGSIMEEVWRQINRADFIVADLTGRNPNVFYELGIAHTVGKPVIMLSQSIDDVPFDVRHNRVVLYGIERQQVAQLRSCLSESIKSVLRDLECASILPGA